MRRFVFGAALAASVALVGHSAFGDDQTGNFRLLRLDGHHVKWGTPTLGTAAEVSYAFVTESMRFPGAINCEALAPLVGLLDASGLTSAQFEREAAAAFTLWQAVADISFSRATEPAGADILIGAVTSPRGRRAYANVAYVPAGGAARSIAKALICLDATQPWKVGFGGDPDAYDIRYTLAHEIGHAIGLDHPGPSGELMSFSYGEAFRALRPGDIAGAPSLRPPAAGR